MASFLKWTFYDPVSLESYTFEVNPKEGGSPAFEKTFQFVNTTASDGKTLIFEGSNKPQQINFSGTLLEESQYNAFVSWWQHRNQVKITDDLGREFYIVIETFKPVRKRSIQHQWKHDYEVTSTIVDWP